MSQYHVPVLLHESVNGLNINPDGIYVDATFGGGGHSAEIIKKLSGNGKLFAFEQDADAWKNELQHPEFTLIKHNFRYIKNFLRYYQVEKIDGILADLGVSSYHFDTADRGFSFRFDGKLDMRMNTSMKLSAKDVLNSKDEDELVNLFRNYGEIKNSRQLVRHILAQRDKQPFDRITQFVELLKPVMPRNKEHKYLAQVFQALRIYVNKELDALKHLLEDATSLLANDGRFVVITYHSLEDRLVKNYFKTGNFEGKTMKDFYGNKLTPFELVNRKVIIPSEQELIDNNRSRSAKLRIANKKTGGINNVS